MNNNLNLEVNKFQRGLVKNVINIDIYNMIIDHNVWVYHHTDQDGYTSGNIVERWLSERCISEDVEIHLIPADYNTDFSSFDIKEDDFVIFVDLSFTSKTFINISQYIYTKTNNIIWIDHHASNVDLVQDPVISNIIDSWLICVLGDKNNKYSAAMLVYCTLFDSIPALAPEYIKLCSDWDTWTHEMPNSIYLNEALNGDPNFRLVNEEGEINQDSTYIKLWEESTPTSMNKATPILNSLIEKGKPIIDDRRIKNEHYLRSNGFEFNLMGYSMLVCNQRNNSLLFGDKINEYDIVCPFVLQERNGKLIYTYSLFSAKADVDCQAIAELFGGGGHKGAAGFSLKWNLFTTNKLLLKFKLFILKLKNKKGTIK